MVNAMPNCLVCGEKLNEGSRTCHVCGTSVSETVLAAQFVAPPAPAAPVQSASLDACPPGGRICPACGKTYLADYADTFCTCGVELVAPAAPSHSPGSGHS